MSYNQNNLTAIKNHALRFPNIEVCGLVVYENENHTGISKEEVVFPCKNISPEPENRFVLDPSDFLNASYFGVIISLYHSHPTKSAEPSELDKQISNGFKLKSIIYSVAEDSFNYYIPNILDNDYFNVEFQIGINDCYTCIQQFYKREFQIELRHRDRDENWQNTDERLMFRHIKEENFNYIFKNCPIKLSKLQRGDILIFGDGRTEKGVHLGLYVGNGLFFHHNKGCHPKIDEYSNGFLAKTAAVIRHRDVK